MPVGEKLKALRNVRDITVRQVEQASRRIADVKGDKRYCISNGWLAQLENGTSEPSICKLFSLSAIYHVKYLELLRLYGVDLNEIQKYEQVANPELTQLLSADARDNWRTKTSASLSVANFSGAATALVPASEPSSVIYGYIGLNDLTMFPLIRPGAFVRIDTTQTKTEVGPWHNEYERPIYFVELRDAYACGWCELLGKQLLIIPHHSSPSTIRRFIYLKEAEIVGRVTGYDTGCV